ncbi:MAG: hypothetical protein KDK71_07245, partial [Chlamydiia bacterium]|nr:hypothetical protein [Chlamydiia bacterium]
RLHKRAILPNRQINDYTQTTSRLGILPRRGLEPPHLAFALYLTAIPRPSLIFFPSSSLLDLNMSTDMPRSCASNSRQKSERIFGNIYCDRVLTRTYTRRVSKIGVLPKSALGF